MAEVRAPTGGVSPDGGAAERSTPARGLARFLPILAWASRYRRAWLRGDLVAGLAERHQPTREIGNIAEAVELGRITDEIGRSA